MATAPLGTHMGFLNSTLFFPYATEAVDVISVDLGDSFILRASFPVLTYVLYEEILLVPRLVCRTVTR